LGKGGGAGGGGGGGAAAQALRQRTTPIIGNRSFNRRLPLVVCNSHSLQEIFYDRSYTPLTLEVQPYRTNSRSQRETTEGQLLGATARVRSYHKIVLLQSEHAVPQVAMSWVVD